LTTRFGERRRARDIAEAQLAAARQALQQHLAALGVNPDFELIEQLRREPKRPVSAGPGRFLLRESSGVVVWHQPPNGQFNATSLTLDLAAAETAKFAGKSFHWCHRSQRRFNRPQPRPGTETFDAEKVGSVIRLRHWQPGDRFQPIGLPAAAKLQDLFVNAKVPARQRRERVVAATASGVIFWVEGLRLGEPFKLTPATRRKLVWQWR
jgi:tRNA(Ile)-lysidine synthetase-like protein